MTSHHDSQKHIAFDFGKLSFGSVSKKLPQFFGAKFRYEYGFNGQDSHRFSIEGYWHPTFFNIRGWRYDNKCALNYQCLKIYRIHKYAQQNITSINQSMFYMLWHNNHYFK